MDEAGSKKGRRHYRSAARRVKNWLFKKAASPRSLKPVPNFRTMW
jgi:hypothetical protein